MPPDEASLLHRIRDGRTDLVWELLAAGRPATSTDEAGVPIIRWCAYHGDVSAIRHLIANGERLESLGANLDLNGAAFHGHWGLCQFLLENGADARHALAETGETPLHAALCKANRPVYEHVVEVLLTHGADPNAPALVGAETGAFMRDVRTRGETPLHRAGAFGTQRSIQMLLEAGGDRGVRDANGDTPLTWASWHLRPPAILRLLAYGSHTIDASHPSTYDHGAGWSSIDEPARGRPHGVGGEGV